MLARMDVGGQFIGIELDEAVGKNSGTVKDKEYFVCPSMHGVICRYKFIMKEILEILAVPLHLYCIYILYLGNTMSISWTMTTTTMFRQWKMPRLR